jgi:hypothetical protein
MNFVSLMRHGLNALAVHSELVAVRLLVATGAFCLVGVALLAGVIFIRLFTPPAVPGWATYVSGFIAFILLQILSITFAFTIHTFSDMNSMAFLPVRDCPYFIGDIKSLPVAVETSSDTVGTCTSVYG